MASYHLSVKTVSRATGRSAPAAAAYRTASRIENERDGMTHDYTRRSGVEASFIVVPAGAAWAQDRSALWNAVEAAEKRKDAKVAREYELALPHELTPNARRALTAGFAREVVSRFGVAADVAIHAPHPEGDQRNWHAHVLTTTRVVEAEGLGAKTRELDVVQTSGPAVEALRELWAVQVNHALERIQSAARVDHRSFARRGEDLVATQHLGPAAAGIERKAARRERAPEAVSRPEAVQATSVAALVPAQGREQVPQRVGVLPEPVPPPERAQKAIRAIPAPVEAPSPVQAVRAAQDSPGRVRAASEAVLRPEAVSGGQEVPGTALRPSAGVCGAGWEPVTRIGQHNAAVQERNRLAQAAQRALEAARRVLDGLERAAVAGVQRVLGLARGLGTQAAAERERQAREAERERQQQERQEQARQEAARQEQARRIDAAHQEQARWTARAWQDQAPSAPMVTQAQRDAARQARVWSEVQEAGRRAREADRARQGPDRERSREREGPSMER